MNKKETAAILVILKTAYPNFYKDASDVTNAIDLWSMMFADDNAAVVTEAVKVMITTLKHPPTIADVKERIRIITTPQAITEIEAWNIVYKAIQNANYGAQESFDKFPETIQRLVGSPGQLREWALMDSEKVGTVIQSNFMRSYSARVKSEQQIQALPESTRQMMMSAQKKIKLIGK